MTTPVAVERAYDLWLWLDARVTDFPVHARHSVGQRVSDASVDLLDALVVASFSERGSAARREALERSRHRVGLLRLLVRGARERKYLSPAQHEFAAERLATLGRMVAGWTRWERERAP
jgi:hypothetical protein